MSGLHLYTFRSLFRDICKYLTHSGRCLQKSGEATDTWEHFAYQTTDVAFHVEHGKTDKHGNFVPLDVVLPRGNLTKLLLAHISQGQAVRMGYAPDPEGPATPLFVSGGRLPFSNCTFDQYWAGLLKRTARDIPHFPPSLARTSYVEDFMSGMGDKPRTWDGAAVIMGNSVKTWRQNYAPTLRVRSAREVIALHAEFTRRRMEAAGARASTSGPA